MEKRPGYMVPYENGAKGTRDRINDQSFGRSTPDTQCSSCSNDINNFHHMTPRVYSFGLIPSLSMSLLSPARISQP